MNDVVSALREVLPPEALFTDAEALRRYSHDDAEWAAFGEPAAVVLAGSVDDVVAAVRV
ncbi:hypothetical protein N136_02339, partial [Leifsonia aquatica ATCC 14665]